jgi:hypothetical protein
MKGLADRSRRPRSSPNRVVAEVAALACELRLCDAPMIVKRLFQDLLRMSYGISGGSKSYRSRGPCTA